MDKPPLAPSDEPMHDRRMAWIDHARGAMVGLAGDYPEGHAIRRHRHDRAQLLYAKAGVVLFKADDGRWIVPTGYAIWVPAGVDHAVEMLGAVNMQSIYVGRTEAAAVSGGLGVFAPTDLARSLIAEVVLATAADDETERMDLVKQLLLFEISRMEKVPLSLPLPADAKLLRLCRRFLDDPARGATIDDWASRVGMSRRGFTRAFQRETGLSLSTWRQQACLFAALPRLSEGESVTNVAIDLGYDSTAAFTTMFRRMLGVPPRTYLARHGTRDTAMRRSVMQNAAPERQ